MNERLNVYQRKDGRYEGRLTLGFTEGKRSYKAFYGKTAEEVTEKMLEFRRTGNVNGVPAAALPLAPSSVTVSTASTSPLTTSTVLNPAIEKMTFGTVYAEWFYSVTYRVKESTAANYTNKADKHVLPTFRDTPISEITQYSIYQFIKSLQDSGLSNRYICDILVLVQSVFRYAARTYRIFNPMDGLIKPRTPKPELNLLTPEEDAKLLKIVVKNPDSTMLGIALARFTGLRVGEVCALQWSDIDFNRQTLKVSKTVQRVRITEGVSGKSYNEWLAGADENQNAVRKTKLILTDPKSETSKRVIPIPRTLLDYIKKFYTEETDDDTFVLSGTSKPLEPRTMQMRFARVLEKANLPSVHFHSLRHYFASLCIKLGFDVKALSEILGHSSVEITLNRYVHTSFDMKVEYMNRLKMKG